VKTKQEESNSMPGKHVGICCPSAVEEIVKVYTFGAGKYGDNNWQNLPDGYNRYKAAMFRHLVASENGEQLDNESGLPHLAHMAWNGIALLHFYMEEDLNKKNHD
jgi:hypothetical protein